MIDPSKIPSRAPPPPKARPPRPLSVDYRTHCPRCGHGWPVHEPLCTARLSTGGTCGCDRARERAA